MNVQQENARELVKELRAELKDNRREIKRLAKQGDYIEAAHLCSVNMCLDYVITRMTCGSGAIV